MIKKESKINLNKIIRSNVLILHKNTGCQSYDDEKCCEFMDENISKESKTVRIMRKVCKKERKIVENAS